MSDYKGKIYIGTVLLEKNRWTTRIPSLQVNDWVKRFAKDGFDGVELWENHAIACSIDEFKKFKVSPCPITVYNSYVNFDDEGGDMREKAAGAINDLGVHRVKFNFGKDPLSKDTYIRNAKSWVKLLPENCKLLCECHAGTIMEEPEAAAEILNILGKEHFEAIVHAMGDTDMLEKWFDHLGGAITHAHIGLRNENRPVTLRSNSAKVIKNIEVMKKRGYLGSYTIEFTQGVRNEVEDIEELYYNALDDLNFLRECIK